MTEMIAPCGLNCAGCEAYIATVANDQAELEKIAAKWRTEYNAPDITVAGVTCLGCASSTGPWCGHCAECEIRACAQGRGYVTCAECADYPCEQLTGFLAMVPPARENLESLRK
jgi:hypothetical protein